MNKTTKCSHSVLFPYCPNEPDPALDWNKTFHDGNNFDDLVERELQSLPILDNVINLSDYPLTESQREILNKGLKFCPTPGEPQMGELRRDLDKFHRSLRLQCHFKKHDESISDEPNVGPYSNTRSLKLSSKSNWTPPPMGPNNLETVVSLNELGLLDTDLNRPKKRNTTAAHKTSISELLANKNIVIKPADKGGATVIQNRTDYVKEGERQLSDTVNRGYLRQRGNLRQ